jgi:hypothetical protein
VPSDGEPLVVHAPSRRAVKGTEAVIAGVKELQAEGLKFRFALVENLTNEQARDVYRQASIIVDQLRIGWYGVLAVESMALGKATVSYVRDDLNHHVAPYGALANANPHTIKDVLRDLVQNEQHRKRLGAQGRAYCEKVHDSARVASDLVARYRAAAENPQPASIESCLNYLLKQRDYTKKFYRKAFFVSPKQVKSGRVAQLVRVTRENGIAFTGRYVMKWLRRRAASLVGRR